MQFPIHKFETTPTELELIQVITNYSRTMEEPSTEGQYVALCLYRHGQNACFIGALLTDEEALSADERAMTVEELLVQVTRLKPLAPHLGLMEKLQSIHDFSWRSRATALLRAADRAAAEAGA